MAILAMWTIIVMLMTGGIGFLFLYGDCAGDAACEQLSKRNGAIIFGTAFVIYWAVFISLIQKWNR